MGFFVLLCIYFKIDEYFIITKIHPLREAHLLPLLGLLTSFWPFAPNLSQYLSPSRMEADSSGGRESHDVYVQSLLMYEMDQNGTILVNFTHSRCKQKNIPI